MALHDEVSWIFSGIGGVAILSLLAWVGRARRRTTRNLSRVVDQLRNSSLATGLPEAIGAMVGLTVWFKGRVVQAEASLGGQSVTVDFELRRGTRVRCTFERRHSAEIFLVKVGQKRRVVGTIIRATSDLIVVCPLPSA
jgi:hypothetical protein